MPGEPAGHDAGGSPPWYPQAESPFPATRSPFPPAEPPQFPSADPPRFPSAEPPPFPPAQPAAAGSGYPETAPAAPAPAEPAAAPQAENPYPSAEESYKGLPRRVRQASLAPQLRDKSASRPAPAASGDSGASDRSPEQIRSALSAIQRGWQEGRGSGGGESPAHGPGEATGAMTGETPAQAGERRDAENGDDDQASTQSWPIISGTTPADQPAEHPDGGSPAGANGEGDGWTGNGGYADYSAQPVYSEGQASTERRGAPAEAGQPHSVHAARTAEPGRDTSRGAAGQAADDNEEQSHLGGNDDG